MTEGETPGGIKVPPAELKQTIDKTVVYIQKNGETFEERLRNNEGSNQKFTFLQEGDEFNGYYQWKLGRKGGTVVESKKPVKGGAEDKESKPRGLNFITTVPPISPLDMDIIKLTALFVAKNGSSYLQRLGTHQMQQGNKAQFEFLDKKHSLHPVFQQFVEQYKLLLGIFSDKEGDANAEEVMNRLSHPEEVLEAAYERAKYNRKHKVDLQNEKKLEEQKQLAYASIDWQDFAIVGKIEFDAVDEVKELAIPISREDLIYRSLEAKQRELELPKAESKPQEEPEEQEEKQEEPQTVAQHKPKGMKIRAAGESRLKNRTTPSASHHEATIKCPITGKLIPELKFDNHLKVLLRDPSYKEQQDNFVRKNFTYASNLTTDEVYNNIKRLARKRDGTADTTADSDPVSKRKQIGPQ